MAESVGLGLAPFQSANRSEDPQGECIFIARSNLAHPEDALGTVLEAKEHVGGLWILETANMDEAMAWARKGAKACRASLEVQEIFFVPAPEEN